MKNLLTAFAILFSVSAFAQMGEKNFIDKNYIEVTGKSEMEFTPDKIYIQVLLNEKDSKNKNAISEQEKQMLQKLQSLGIDTKKDVMIKDLASNLKNGFLSKDVLLSKQYQIIVHDGKTAGRVFLALEEIGISNASIEKLESSKIEEYRQEVKIKAIKAAKEKAALLTESIGQKAGKALFIQEQNVFERPVYANTVMYKAKAEGATDAADLNFENLKVEATVMVRFEIL
ncbi:SIMPL domain-containing protein [Niabella ginsengisoli]|uniref:SIMPL domain-containing protein n=1 Tax=Niabella ginsengisoli TaxID=522298 RepID=A0ABS9SP03_9BACT|nr:SIMPL domain-containing protein [Niabella ginsengisoli]MCH5600119.1 SIMPL domain-containing protein [Niabella ginsengisoli]